ncbi:DUF5134 domain-containing protein [Nocardia vermiculata]|uniref:DUF5134 domain-containing protein n=1 Tax=Nocardia vermiculata TaxID=257274 RepID=A0A846Y995_9NOCA|nr:DUF5134 domain-containing protein [Nocardia vermiculata]NKY53319.1 DUF5134 domain-containing protein [Nocardia vermiculata]
MGSLITEYPVLRWTVAVAFGVAAVIVLARHVRAPVGDGTCDDGTCDATAADRESDAAHLMMCLVMIAMLVFPTAAAPGALRGVLIAMVVVYAGLLVTRIPAWRPVLATSREPRTGPGSGVRAPALIYHLVAAGAMLWVMSGHRHGAEPVQHAPAVLVAILAALFVLDAIGLVVPRTRRILRHGLSHPPGPPDALGPVPHVVMDLGTAYMLIAAVAG